MSTTFIRRRQAHHNNVGVLSDADQWQAHGRLRQAARSRRERTDMERNYDHVDAMRKRVEDGGELTREESLHLLEWVYPEWRRLARAMDKANPGADHWYIHGPIHIGVSAAARRAEWAWEHADKAKD